MKKQIYNPYLPLSTCIPDGEPHVFGDRVYIYGSHDKEGGDAFCMLDYEVWSAPVDDLSDWRCEGTIYRAEQDPEYGKPNRYMYAPDVVRGNDGRYYLYYAMAGGEFTGPIHVAVCDTPAGSYEYYGSVRNADGTTFRRGITFDPGLLNDEGTIWLYYGWSLAVEDRPIPAPDDDSQEAKVFREQLIEAQVQIFGKTRQEIEAEPQGIMGANVVRLADDMVTVIGEPIRIVPGQFDAAGTSFERHAFFEASSMRKIGDTYYFIYSPQHQDALCYATSRYPDRDFVYRGILVSNGDVWLHGRSMEERLWMTGNNHGSIEKIGGQWYVFYHRQTHGTTYSRQGCAEPVEILEDGSISQAEMTTQGLNGAPLRAQGAYPAPIACCLTNGHMPHTQAQSCADDVPRVTHEGEERFIARIGSGTLVGYKYFAFEGESELTLRLRGTGSGELIVLTGVPGTVESTLSQGISEQESRNADERKMADVEAKDMRGQESQEAAATGQDAAAAASHMSGIALQEAARISVRPQQEWHEARTAFSAQGVQAMYLYYQGEGTIDLEQIAFPECRSGACGSAVCTAENTRENREGEENECIISGNIRSGIARK
ncbi:MAG: family 43 glycosylhydrolase [Eubacteriales bacterium]|nr:family 43 glycosylhydrolase [Eubacteriales bacterium]